VSDVHYEHNGDVIIVWRDGTPSRYVKRRAWLPFLCGLVAIVGMLTLSGCILTITISTGETPTPAAPTVTVTPTATYEPTPTPYVQKVLWDSRLTELGVSITPSSGKYRLIAAWLTKNGNWDDVPDWAHQWQLDTLGGDHHVFGRCLDAAGNPIAKTFQLSWPGGSDGRTPEADGWANLPMAGQNWNPANGPGPYTWYALNGDKLSGVGMPLNNHWSFFGVWQEQPAAKAPTLGDIIVNWFWPR